MTLILKSRIHYSDGTPQVKNCSKMYLYVDPRKLRGTYDVRPLAFILAKIISAEPADDTGLNEYGNYLYETVSGLPISFIFQPAYEIKDFLFISKSSYDKLSRVGIIPDRFVLTVEISAIKGSLTNRKIYPKAQVYDNQD